MLDVVNVPLNTIFLNANSSSNLKRTREKVTHQAGARGDIRMVRTFQRDRRPMVTPKKKAANDKKPHGEQSTKANIILSKYFHAPE